jgi:hypothetical protein
VGRIPVRGCVWSKFEVIDKYERIIKLMSEINRQVRHYFTCVCLVFLTILSELYKLRFQRSDVVKSFHTLSKEV